MAICLLLFLIAALIFLTLSGVPDVEKSNNLTTKPMVLNPRKQTSNWEVRLPQQYTEASLRLVDVDGDGLLDILAATAPQKFVDVMIKMKGKQVTKEDLKQVCHNEGQEYPCIGNIRAYRGYDGKQLWMTPFKSEMFLINCEEFDINKDRKKDCIGTGRLATLIAFDPFKGVVLWEGEEGRFLRSDWNTYQARALPDWDADGVPEVLVVNGGAPIIPAHVHNRTAGRLIVFSGATGEQLGQRYLEIPNSKESYMSPVIYKSTTGSSYILFGSGGETVPGDLLGISVSDFCKYIMDSHASVCPPSDADFIWKSKVRDNNGIFILFSDARKGVMVPPVIVDVNRDGVDDIVLNSFGGFIVLLDGVDLKPVWTTEFNGTESYSTPAPGYFDDDYYLDFMLHQNVGAWPYYTYSYTTILSGKDGSKLWSLGSSEFEAISDFTMRTKEEHRDIFIFRVTGRDASILYNASDKIVTSEGMSHTREARKRRHTKDGKDHDINKSEGLVRKDKGKAVKAGNKKNYMDCEMDLNVNPGTEVIMIDRTTLHFGIKIKEDLFEKVKYNINDEEERCMLLETNEFSTGAIADVDGDGTLDYLSIVALEGTKFGSNYKMSSNEDITKISKVNIFPHFSKMDRIYLNAVTRITRKAEEKSIEEVGVLHSDQQQWTQYLGNNSNNHYSSG